MDARVWISLTCYLLCILLIFVNSLSVVSAFSTTYSVKGFSANVTQLLNSLQANYDENLRPGYGGPPTVIRVNMNVRSMGPFSEKEESYAMQLYLRHVWYDPRLRFHKDLWGRSEFSMNWMFADKLWKPDTFFINGKNSYHHRITTPNMFFRLRHDGQITWSMRLTVRATCLMHLRKFPLDTQQCPLKMASYGFRAQDIIYEWDPKKLVTVASDVSIAQYELGEITTHEEKVITRKKEEISTLLVKFHLRRQTGFFMLQVYIPCVLIVCCSWVAFWITKKDVPGRVGLGVTTVLSMTTLGFGGRATGPPVSYATALDYFVILCFAFVFAAVLEFAFINFGERAANKRRKKFEELRKQILERITANASGGTMMVTTTIEEGKPILKETLRHLLNVPLSAVPLAEENVVTVDEPHTGDMREGIKSLMTVPLTVLPDTSETLRKEEEEAAVGSHIHTGDTKEGYETMAKVPLLITADVIGTNDGRRGSAISLGGQSQAKKRRNGTGENVPSDTKAESSHSGGEGPPSIVVDVSDDDPPPTPPRLVTIWDLLMQKQKLLMDMSPSFIIPAEEDILERFSIVDLYSRRIFPSLFFFFTALYWFLFTYYITDEFPGEKKTPSDGLIVT